MASTSIASFHLSFPERPYHYRKATAVGPSYYSTVSYKSASTHSSSIRKSYSFRPSPAGGIITMKGEDRPREAKGFDTLPLSQQAPDPPNKRPTVYGRFMTNTLKKLEVKRQKSLASLPFFPVNDIPASIISSHPESSRSASPAVRPPVDMVIDVVAEPQGGTVDRFLESNLFRRRQGTHLHPYPQEAPYMQAYDPILLENDRYTECLLRRLTFNTPSFRDYTKKAPTNVLDLGCGEGRWVLEAAVAWRAHGTKVTGFDLMDVLCDLWEDEKVPMHNVNFVRGNFVKYDLPFLDNSFDFVRMANLSLCIPYDRWEFVLREVKRVLTQDGRLELIDDHIFFPYEKRPPSSPSACRPFPSASSFDAEDDGQSSADVQSTSAAPTSVDSDAESLSAQDKLRLRLQGSYPTPLPDPYDTQEASSKCLETLYARMLEEKYGIHPRPSGFIRSIMTRVFGKRGVNKVASMHLSLAPPGVSGDKEKEEDWASLRSSHSSNSSSLGHASGKKTWMSVEWDKKERPSRSSSEMSSPSLSASGSPVPVVISTKAAARLGLTPSALSLPESMSPKAAGRLGIAAFHPQHSTPRQTPGLILWPSTFIPMSPSELEMHVCKHIHVLLGCKAALEEFIAPLRDENDKRLVGEKEFDDLIWDYECFRRHRFNWPSDVPEINLEDSSSIELASKSATFHTSTGVDSSPSHSRSNSNSDPVKYRFNELTHVRTIRVYEAFKLD